jgi:hypothetical protein
MTAFSSGNGVISLSSDPSSSSAPQVRDSKVMKLLIAVVLELVLDGVDLVWAGFLEKLPEVVRRQPRLTLVAA